MSSITLAVWAVVLCSETQVSSLAELPNVTEKDILTHKCLDIWYGLSFENCKMFPITVSLVVMSDTLCLSP